MERHFLRSEQPVKAGKECEQVAIAVPTNHSKLPAPCSKCVCVGGVGSELHRTIVSISSIPILWAGQVGAWQLLYQKPEVEKEEILEVTKPVIELVEDPGSDIRV